MPLDHSGAAVQKCWPDISSGVEWFTGICCLHIPFATSSMKIKRRPAEINPCRSLHVKCGSTKMYSLLDSLSHYTFYKVSQCINTLEK